METYGGFRGPGDGENVVSLSKEPGQSYLAGGYTVFPRELLNAVDDFEDVREVLLREARQLSARVVLFQVIRGSLRCEGMGEQRSVSPGIVVEACVDTLTYFPVSKPRPTGEYATILTPSSRHVFRRAFFSSSMSSVNGEYST